MMRIREQQVEPDDRDAMLSELYDELRAAAARMLRLDAPMLTLRPTELVNEAALKIVRLERMSWNDKRHFFATGARMMRQAMLDEVRSRRRAKRQAPNIFLTVGDQEPTADIEAVDAALNKLEAIAPELAQIVELRFFVGLTVPEIALATDTSERTIRRRWQTARLWLADELGPA